MGHLTAVAWSASGTKLAACVNGGALNLLAGRKHEGSSRAGFAKFKFEEWPEFWPCRQGHPFHGRSVNVMAWSPSRSILATGSKDGCLRIGDAESGNVEHTLRHPDPVTAVAWNP